MAQQVEIEPTPTSITDLDHDHDHNVIATRRLLQAATRATGYLAGYDDGVNDCLRWLQVQAPTVMAGLIAAIQLNAEVSKSPIKVAEEFLSAASKPEVAQP